MKRIKNNIIRKLQLLIVNCTLLICLFSCSTPKNEVASPDGKIHLSFNIDDDGFMYYDVKVNDSVFITPSLLGFEAKNGLNLKNSFVITKTKFTSENETWSQIWGENKTIRNNYNEMAVHLENEDSIFLVMRFRLFNDGLGFRYEYKVTDIDSVIITDELTSFNIKENGTSWSIPASFETYELLYRTLPINEVEDANTPFTFKTESGIYASIHEAALTDFPEMTLKKTEKLKTLETENNFDSQLLRFSDSQILSFKTQLAPYPDKKTKAIFTSDSQRTYAIRLSNSATQHLSNLATQILNFKTPWRTIQISDKAVGLINSNLILNLNEPCVLEGDLSWIRPMKYVGVWWSMHLGVESWVINDRHGATTENAKRYIDFAANNNIDAVLFEGWNEGWDSWGGRQNFDFTKAYADFDIDEIMRYAKERNIEVIGHHETGGNIANYERQLEEAYRWTAGKGIHCVKTGYAGGLPDGHNHHGQYNVRHYRKVVETAARHHITLDVHEPIKPTGIRRTYPNMMTREGARGMEWNAWSEGNPPEHHVTLPFTRLLAGPMDYTPGTFDILFENTRNSPQRKKWNDNDKGNSRVNTTLAKQLANWVILYSPLQMASDMIEHYEGHPAFQFFRDFNPDCDWSEALQGEPGEYIVVVRRAGEDFFLGAATNGSAREVAVPLTFLPENHDFVATIYSDGDDAHWETNPTSYKIEKKIISHSDTLFINMAAGGGCAVSFKVITK
ncbi:MAG: glycoside hydrolase family 97 protein [Bacteroidales bacterium]|nr:glycoside hydrolase family 97 protein [Bacteroidales bacterium]